MAIPPTQKSTYPNVPVAPGVPAVLRQVGSTQAAVVSLVADAAQIAQIFLPPQWGIFDQYGSPVLASSSTIQQIVGSITGNIQQIASFFGSAGQATFACSVGSLNFSQDYQISKGPQEQGAFLSYNKVQEPFGSRVSFLVGGTAPQRSAFLATVAALASTLDLYSVVMPELTYPSVNVTHYDFRRMARSGVSLLAVNVWVEQVRVSGTTAYSTTTTATPSGADAMTLGTVQPVQYASTSFAAPPPLPGLLH